MLLVDSVVVVEVVTAVVPSDVGELEDQFSVILDIHRVAIG